MGEFYDKFVVDYEESCVLEAVGKDLFTHEEDGWSYKYRYVIVTNRIDNDIELDLYMVPEWDSLCEKAKDRVLSWYGYSDLSYFTEYELPEFFCAECLSLYGVLFKHQVVNDIMTDDDGWYGLSSYDQAIELLDVTASKLDKYEGLYGFYMDCPIDREGHNGWNLMDEAINGEKSPFPWRNK